MHRSRVPVMLFPYFILIYCFVLCQTSHHPHGADHVPTTYRPPLQHISTSYCFRIVSVLFPLPEARTIGERQENDTGMIRDRYGINTGLIRDRYENGLFRLLTDEIDMNSNFFIIVSLDYILHFSHLPLPVVYAKKTGSPFALAQPLYKDNLPSSRMQADQHELTPH